MICMTIDLYYRNIRALEDKYDISYLCECIGHSQDRVTAFQ